MPKIPTNQKTRGSRSFNIANHYHAAPPLPHLPKFDPRSPYLGLRCFEEKDKGLFFGRAQLVNELCAKVSKNHCILIAGASGSGKSSLVNAGLIPKLREQHQNLRVFSFIPDKNPFESLHHALISGAREEYSPEELEWVRKPSEDTFVRLVSKPRRPDKCWLFFIDQLEQCFTRCSDELRQCFFTAMLRLSQLPKEIFRHAILVVAMRADFLSRFEGQPALSSLLRRNIEIITSPDISELEQCIKEPALRHGVWFEDGLVHEIIADVQGQAGLLPALQYTLDQLWTIDNPSNDRTLNTVSYRALGGARGALGKRANELYSSLRSKGASDDQDVMRRIFLRLVDLSDEAAGGALSRRVPITEFFEAEQKLISLLVREKLLVMNSRPHGDSRHMATVEVAHDALLSAWDQLKEWIAEARQVIYVHVRLAADAERWLKLHRREPERANEELWGYSRLQQANDMQERGDFQNVRGGLTPGEEAFLKASRIHRERQKQEEEEKELRAAKDEWEQDVRDRREREQAAQVNDLKLFTEALTRREQQAQAVLKKQQDLCRDLECKRQLLVRKLQQQEHDNSTLKQQMQNANAEFHAQASKLEQQQRALQELERDRQLLDQQLQQQRDEHVALERQAQVECAKILGEASLAHAEVARQQSAFDELANEKQLLAQQLEQQRNNLRGLRVYAIIASCLLTMSGVANFSRFMQGYRPPIDVSSVMLREHPTPTPPPESPPLIIPQKRDGGTSVEPTDPHNLNRLVEMGRQCLVEERGRRTEAALLYLHHAYEQGSKHPMLPWLLADAIRPFDCAKEALSKKSAVAIRKNCNASFRKIANETINNTIQTPPVLSRDLPKDLVKPVFIATRNFDGQRIITVARKGIPELWDAQSGKKLRSLNGHKGRITGASFSSDGSRIITTSREEVRIWATESGLCVRILKGRNEDIERAYFGKDDRSIVIVSRDHTAWSWDAAPENRNPKDLAYILCRFHLKVQGTKLVAAEPDPIKCHQFITH